MSSTRSVNYSPIGKGLLADGLKIAEFSDNTTMSNPIFTHITDDRAAMVDISGKDAITRRAVATGRIVLRQETIAAINAGSVEKGNVLATARIAAIMAVKETPSTIPMCHQIPITGIDVNFEVADDAIHAFVEVKSVGRTGVEMETLSGVSVALLTIWDMVKSAEKDESGNYPHTAIMDIRVIEKVKYHAHQTGDPSPRNR